MTEIAQTTLTISQARENAKTLEDMEAALRIVKQANSLATDPDILAAVQAAKIVSGGDPSLAASLVPVLLGELRKANTGTPAPATRPADTVTKKYTGMAYTWLGCRRIAEGIYRGMPVDWYNASPDPVLPQWGVDWDKAISDGTMWPGSVMLGEERITLLDIMRCYAKLQQPNVKAGYEALFAIRDNPAITSALRKQVLLCSAVDRAAPLAWVVHAARNGALRVRTEDVEFRAYGAWSPAIGRYIDSVLHART